MKVRWSSLGDQILEQQGLPHVVMQKTPPAQQQLVDSVTLFWRNHHGES
jgi:hypothetical protein